VYASNPLDGYVYTLDGATNDVTKVAVVESRRHCREPGHEPGVRDGARNVTVLNGRSSAVVPGWRACRTRGIAVDVARNKIYATTNGGVPRDRRPDPRRGPGDDAA
jgi:hypothetical protein